MNDYRITHHARERYVERGHKKYHHLETCKLNIGESCLKCQTLMFEIKEIVQSERSRLDSEIRSSLLNGNEDRSYLNDTQFMAKYYERHGFDHRIRFIVDGEFVFVLLEKDGNKSVVTCLLANRHRSVQHTKFKKQA